VGGEVGRGEEDPLTKEFHVRTLTSIAALAAVAPTPTIAVKGVADGSAEELFENRKVKVVEGMIVDEFAPYAVHRYRIAG